VGGLRVGGLFEDEAYRWIVKEDIKRGTKGGMRRDKMKVHREYKGGYILRSIYVYTYIYMYIYINMYALQSIYITDNWDGEYLLPYISGWSLCFLFIFIYI
jgi:hypothetical protein